MFQVRKQVFESSRSCSRDRFRFSKLRVLIQSSHYVNIFAVFHFSEHPSDTTNRFSKADMLEQQVNYVTDIAVSSLKC